MTLKKHNRHRIPLKRELSLLTQILWNIIVKLDDWKEKADEREEATQLELHKQRRRCLRIVTKTRSRKNTILQDGPEVSRVKYNLYELEDKNFHN